MQFKNGSKSRKKTPKGKSNTPRKRPSPPNPLGHLWVRAPSPHPSPKGVRGGRGVRARPAVRLFPFGKKTAVSNRPLFQKVFLTLGCLVGLLLALIPSQAPASNGGSLEWKTVLPGGYVQDSSPTLADIDGDGKDEIIIGTTSNGSSPILAVLEDNGSIKWTASLPHAMGSTATVVDISSPADGIPEIIVTTGFDIHNFSAAGAVIAFDRDGNQLWRYNTNDAQGTGRAHGNFSSVVPGDVDNDGDMELAFGSWDRNIYLLDHQGNYIWHYRNTDTIWSTPVLVDLDHNDTLELVIGTDINSGGILPDGYQPTNGGFVLILDKDGNLMARRQINETIYSSPAVADADNDGVYEIFVGTGMYFYNQGNYSQPYVYGFSINMSGPADQYGVPWVLEDLSGWPQAVAYPGMSSAAIADLDNDGDLEVVIGTGDSGGGSTACTNNTGDTNCTGALYAWQHTGESLPGFPMWPKEANGKNWPLRSSPTIGDVDGDNQLEIAVALGWEIAIVGHNGSQEQALHTDCTVLASPAIGDPDDDGQTNLIIGGCDAFNNTSNGHVYNFEMAGESYNEGAVPWGQFHRDAQNSGLYTEAPIGLLGCGTTSVSMLQQIGDNDSPMSTLQLVNSGGASVNYDIRNISSSSIQLSSTSGEIAAGSQVPLTITTDTTGLGEGRYELGLFDVYDSDKEQFTCDVSVTVVVGDLTHIYLPLTTR